MLTLESQPNFPAEDLSEANTTLDHLTLISDIREIFNHEMPRTRGVIKESTPCHLLPYCEYALASAALARMAEIDVTGSAI